MRYKDPRDNLVSYYGHKPGCICDQCGEARDLTKLLARVCKVKKQS